MSESSRTALAIGLALVVAGGCSTMKESHTSRTGIEQLLISSAADEALDKVDLGPIVNTKVMLETKYLDCVDKNYIIVSLQQRLLHHGCTLTDKPEEAEVVLVIASGGVGTDGNEMYVGVPEIPLPSSISIEIPKLTFFSRTKLMGTAKIMVIAYDAKSKLPLLDSGYALARSDLKTLNVMGMGSIQGGSLQNELAAATGKVDSISTMVPVVAQRLQAEKEEIVTPNYLWDAEQR